MSLERKDVRVKVDDDVHRALVAVAECDDTDIGLWVERLVVKEVSQRIHQARLLAAKTDQLGLTGNVGECTGK